MTDGASSLLEEVRNEFPYEVTPIVRASIDVLRKLPGMGQWRPLTINWIEAIKLLRWGFPLTFFDESSLSHPFIRRIGDSIIAKGEPDPDDFAEVRGMALLVACGATMALPIERTMNRTHDFDVQWGDAIVEVEVTRANRKPAHLEREQLASAIANEIHELNADKDSDIIIHVQDLLDENEKRQLINAAKAIKIGARVEEPGKWSVFSEKPNRPVDQLLVGGQHDPVPGWWPVDPVNMWSFAQRIPGPQTLTPPPQVRVNFNVPVSGYINPAKRKSTRFQGSRNNPFVIAIDVSVLPKPFDPFRLGLENLFPKWKHISGVLLFRDILSNDKLGWMWDIFPNQYANRPLPSIMLTRMPTAAQPRDTFNFLSTKQESEWLSSLMSG